MTRSRCAAPAVLLTAAALVFPAAAPAAAKTRTYKLSGGTTTLVFAQQAAQNLASMGVSMAATTPATTSADGLTLKFPITGGKVKAKKGKLASGTVKHSGAIVLAKAPLSLPPLDDPFADFSKKLFYASLSGTPMDIGALNVKAARVKAAKKTVTISKVKLSLTETAAQSMNGAFSVTGFKAGDPIGTATLKGTIKR